LNNQKDDTKERFSTVHDRIDKEQKALSDLTKEVALMSPMVKRVATILDWSSRIVVSSMVAGILWAMYQSMGGV
jgi:hypothetical protein